MATMRVVMVSKALVVGVYQRKAEEIARHDVDLTVFIPPAWRDSRGVQCAERGHTHNYRLSTIPQWLSGNYHLHFYPTLLQELRRIQPDIVHMDEEPYNLATWMGLRAARRVGAVGTFFTWQNLNRRYPFPFRWLEQGSYALAPMAMAGSEDAAQVLRCKGYGGPIEVIPQFGIDPQIFRPASAQERSQARQVGAAPMRIAFAGGLVPEKGVDLLLQACAGLRGCWSLQIVGSGSQLSALQGLAHQLGIGERVTFGQRLSSTAMPAFYRSVDVLVLPSRTRPNWKEQFGRVLIEAMASEVAVVGSDSGEIPHVIGAAGLIFAEGDLQQLCAQLQQLLDRPQDRVRLGRAGRQAVLARFTMDRIASQTVDLYRRLLAAAA